MPPRSPSAARERADMAEIDVRFFVFCLFLPRAQLSIRSAPIVAPRPKATIGQGAKVAKLKPLIAVRVGLPENEAGPVGFWLRRVGIQPRPKTFGNSDGTLILGIDIVNNFGPAEHIS